MPFDASGLTLLVPSKVDDERDAVARAFEQARGTVARVDRFWEPPLLNSRAIKVYGNSTFCLVLAQLLQLKLTSPPDDLILKLDNEIIGRRVALGQLSGCDTYSFPLFAKPLVPKLFTARVYSSSSDLLRECQGLPDETDILMSEVVVFTAEARAFILNSVILDCVIYEGEGDPNEANELLLKIAKTTSIPKTLVVDVGKVGPGKWVFIEANAAWGAGLNGCNAAVVLPAIAEACHSA